MAESSVAPPATPRPECVQSLDARYDGPVTQPPPTSPNRASGAQAPGERRLQHPPSDRYAALEIETSRVADEGASVTRAVIWAIAAAIAGAAATTLLGGVLAVSAGLLVIAAASGWGVAMSLRAGARSKLDPRRRVRLALGLATVAVIGGQLGLWLFARYEGGVLGPVEYLAETFGLLIPLQLAIAWIVAALAAR